MYRYLYLPKLPIDLNPALLDTTESKSYKTTSVRIFMILHLSTSMISSSDGTAIFFFAVTILRTQLVWRTISSRPTAFSTHPLYKTHKSTCYPPVPPPLSSAPIGYSSRWLCTVAYTYRTQNADDEMGLQAQ